MAPPKKGVCCPYHVDPLPDCAEPQRVAIACTFTGMRREKCHLVARAGARSTDRAPRRHAPLLPLGDFHPRAVLARRRCEHRYTRILLQKSCLFSQLLLSLSRACLGKMVVLVAAQMAPKRRSPHRSTYSTTDIVAARHVNDCRSASKYRQPDASEVRRHAPTRKSNVELDVEAVAVRRLQPQLPAKNAPLFSTFPMFVPSLSWSNVRFYI